MLKLALVCVLIWGGWVGARVDFDRSPVPADTEVTVLLLKAGAE